MSPRHNLSFCAYKTAWFAPEWQLYMGSSPHLCLLDAKQHDLHAKQRDRMTRIYWFQPSLVFFCMQNSDFWTRITSLYGSQTWPVILRLYNSVISIRITRLYGLQPSSEVLCIQNSDFWTTMTSLYGFQPSSVFFSFMQNSDFMTRLTCLYGSHTSSVVVSTHNSVLRTRIKGLYGFQASPMVMYMQKQRL